MNIPRHSWTAMAVVIFLAMSLWVATPYPDDHDGVNFVLGVGRFDIHWHQPHFPGYPVYIAAGKVTTTFTGSAEWGLITVSALSMAVAMLALLVISRGSAPFAGAMALLVAMMASPAVFQFGHKIFSEPMGLALLCLSALAIHGASAGPGRWTLSGFMLGLMLGVRLSWWPFAPGLAIAAFLSGRLAPMTAGLAIGIVTWLLPLAWPIGLIELFNTGLAFTQGHFADLGGSATGGGAATESVLTTRVGFLLTNLGAIAGIAPGLWGLIAGAPMALCVGVGMVTLVRHRNDVEYFSTAQRALLIGAGFYICWLALGQNVTKARHFLPFIPVVAIALAPVAKRAPMALLLAAAMMAGGAVGAHIDRHSDFPPPIQMRLWLEKNADRDTTVYCGWAERFFDLYPSKTKVYGAPRADSLPLIIASQLDPSGTRFVCSDIPGLHAQGAPVAVFPPRPADLTDIQLRLFPL
ncbi:MAG: hypothetical protein OEZ04_06200 [Nitrospinota bacterium]|nr:hypothetical protein [Nitrospinota bacterium]